MHTYKQVVTQLFKSEISTPVKIAAAYVFLSLTYIYTSDSALHFLSSNLDTISLMQSFKGTGFVLLSGSLLFFFINRYEKKITRYYANLIEERKTSFDKLKLSEEKYWTVFNSSPLPMWIYRGDDLRFLLVNEAACKNYGYTQEEFYNMRISDIRPQEDLGKLFDAIKDGRGSKHKVMNEPFRHLCKDGTLLFVQIESAEILYENEVARLIIAKDITEKVKNNKLLAETNRRLRSACDIAKLGYWSHDVATSEIYWSDTMFSLFQADKDSFDLTWENVQKFFCDKDAPFFNMKESFKEQDTIEFEHEIITGQGNRRWIFERVMLLSNEDGIPARLEGITVDITHRKQAIQELQSSNERFKMLAKAAFEAIIDWDIHSGEVFWGDGLLELFGHHPRTYDRRRWAKNIHQDDRHRVMDNIARAQASRTTQYFFEEFRFAKANGSIAFVELRGVFVRDDNGVAIRGLGAMTDLTQLREKIVKIEEQNHRLKEIAWIQSHVVRAPLATLMGLTNLLKDMKVYKDVPEVLIAGIIESANKLDVAIHDIEKTSKQN